MKELFYDSTLQKFNGAWEFLSPSGEKSAVELPHGDEAVGRERLLRLGESLPVTASQSPSGGARRLHVAAGRRNRQLDPAVAHLS